MNAEQLGEQLMDMFKGANDGRRVNPLLFVSLRTQLLLEVSLVTC